MSTIVLPSTRLPKIGLEIVTRGFSRLLEGFPGSHFHFCELIYFLPSLSLYRSEHGNMDYLYSSARPSESEMFIWTVFFRDSRSIRSLQDYVWNQFFSELQFH